MTIVPDEQFGEGTAHLMNKDAQLAELRTTLFRQIHEAGKEGEIKDVDILSLFGNMTGILKAYLITAGMPEHEFLALLHANIDLAFNDAIAQEAPKPEEAPTPKKRSWGNLLKTLRR